MNPLDVTSWEGSIKIQATKDNASFSEAAGLE